MSKAELEKIIVEETKELSKETLIEVLDFIHSIKAKKPKVATKKSFEKKVVKELADLNESSLTHLEEEFANYRELYPREQ
ncbi:MAG: hypothetical protein ACE5I5_20700 [Candidatus Heimdallarchaeota archaeon]